MTRSQAVLGAAFLLAAVVVLTSDRLATAVVHSACQGLGS